MLRFVRYLVVESGDPGLCSLVYPQVTLTLSARRSHLVDSLQSETPEASFPSPSPPPPKIRSMMSPCLPLGPLAVSGKMLSNFDELGDLTQFDTAPYTTTSGRFFSPWMAGQKLGGSDEP